MVLIACLHGFLGRPADWDFLRPSFDVAAPDLFAGEPIPAADVLVGYSMGGRLALHALLVSPVILRRIAADRLDAAIAEGSAFEHTEQHIENTAGLAVPRPRKLVLISTSLGIEDEAQRAARRAVDDAWARRFESDAWSSVMHDWNAQPVFGGCDAVREERDFDRAALARALRDWSPGLLPPVASRIHELDIPTLVIAGERDRKYVAEAERTVALLPNAKLWIAEGAGHRVPWERPDAFATRLRAFVD